MRAVNAVRACGRQQLHVGEAMQSMRRADSIACATQQIIILFYCFFEWGRKSNVVVDEVRNYSFNFSAEVKTEMTTNNILLWCQL